MKCKPGKGKMPDKAAKGKSAAKNVKAMKSNPMAGLKFK